jgi:hypothetical protein
LQFAVKFRDGQSAQPSAYPHVRLVQDNWDDYGYKTTYYVTLHLSEVESVDLGTVKILHERQTSGYGPLPREPFEKLTSEFCSLGGDLDYYEKIFKFGQSFYQAYLGGLHDVTFDDEVRDRFEHLEGYKVSLLRFSGAERTITDAAKLFQRDTPVLKRRGVGFLAKFRTQVAEDANSFSIDFDFRRKGPLPHRMNALIGYNGTGKTRLLSNLAIVASGFGYDTKEELLAKRAGRFIGTPPPFKTVVVISYSAFDTFVIPGQTEEEEDKLREDGAIFGYVYCGLRVRAGEVKEGSSRRPTYRLRTPDEVEAEFLSALQRVRKAGRQDALLDILKPLLRDASFQRIGLTRFYRERDNESLVELFRSLSSGHKVVLKIVTEVTAYIGGNEPSLVLIDEPETHLHPPLLAALLKSVRACLDNFDGYAVVATHSPVVLQETPSRYVHVLKRIGDQTQATSPSIETFGESIGVITQEVFNLDDGSTDWHDTLRTMAAQQSLEEVEELFDRRLGFAARSYVISVQGDDEI